MAHFAQLNNNTVVNVIVIADTELLENGIEVEQKGIDFCNTLIPGEWKQTSYNTYGGVHKTNGTPFRKNYAGIGYTYDVTRDAFIPPQPFASWVIDEQTCLWEAPVPRPAEDGKYYYWDEATLAWVEEVVNDDPNV
jgi:hypothetical protein